MITPEKLLHRESYGAYAPFQVIFPNLNVLPQHRWVFERHSMSKGEMDTIINRASQLHQDHRPDLINFYERKRAYHVEPTQEEAFVVQNCLQEYEQEIVRATETVTDTISKIASLCQELSSATCQLAFRTTQRDVCKYLLSPIHYIHDDILQEIFLACLEAEDSIEPYPSRAPLQLAAVCHRWRNVACSFPKLWRDIYVDYRRPGLFPLATTWVQRCRGEPASLTLNIDDKEDLDWLDAFAPFLRGVQESSVQFKRMDLKFRDTPMANEVLPKLLERHSDCLEALAVNTIVDVPISHIPQFRLYLSQFPKATALPLPLSPQLTFLRVEREIHPAMLEVILFQCPSLQKVLVSLDDSFAPPPSNPVRDQGDQVVHPNLEYLGISNEGLRLPLDFLRHFSFPSLRIIEYFARGFRDETVAWLLSHPSIHQIRRLVLQFPQDTNSLLARVLSSAESLEELTLDSYRDTSMTSLMEGLSSVSAPGDHDAAAAATIFLPNLKRLHLSIRNKSLLMSSELQDLIRTWSMDDKKRKLERINLHYARSSLDDEDRERILGMQSQRDVEVRVHYNHAGTVWNGLFPWMFGLYPLAAHEVRTCEVLQGGYSDGRAVMQSGSIYEIV